MLHRIHHEVQPGIFCLLERDLVLHSDVYLFLSPPGEIDRCLKKVAEGVEQFEDIWQKVRDLCLWC